MPDCKNNFNQAAVQLKLQRQESMTKVDKMSDCKKILQSNIPIAIPTKIIYEKKERRSQIATNTSMKHFNCNSSNNNRW